MARINRSQMLASTTVAEKNKSGIMTTKCESKHWDEVNMIIKSYTESLFKECAV